MVATSPGQPRPGELDSPVAPAAVPPWATLLRAPNPGPMTLDGTNTWVLRAGPAAPATVVDPGPADEAHLGRVAATGPVALILITHGHHDHVEGAARLAALTGAPVRAVDPAHCHGGPALGHAETLTVGGLTVRVVGTPGHTADSACFEVHAPAGPGPADTGPAGTDARAPDAVLTGDTILGRGTTVVAWPDGDLRAYLTSLGTLSAYRGIPALTGHGPPLADCAAASRAYLAHRHARLAQVRAVVAAGAGTAEEVVAAVYPGVDPALRPAAEWSVRAQLAYLAAESARAAGAP